MNVHLKAFAWGLIMLSTSVFGQSSKLRELARYIELNPDKSLFGEIVIMPKYTVLGKPDISEKMMRGLERLYAPRHESSVSLVGESIDSPSFSHSLRDSVLAESAMSTASDLKRLKNGFTIHNPFGADFNAYIKSGIAWHPKGEPYVTYTLGNKSSWKYEFRNENDLFRYSVERPLRRLNIMLQKPFDFVFGGF